MEMLWAAIKNEDSGPDNMRLLLAQPIVKEIPSQVFMAAVSNRFAGLEMASILLSYPEKLFITEDILMAAARNSESGPIIISLFISRFGVSILPSFVLEQTVTELGSDFSNGATVATWLLSKKELVSTSEPMQSPDLLSAFIEAWECKMSLDFEDFATIKQPNFTTVTSTYTHPLPYLRTSGNSRSQDEHFEAFEKNNWLQHPVFQSAFVESTKSLTISLARRTKNILSCPANSTKHDIQGLDWDFLGITRKDAREVRMSMAVPYRSRRVNATVSEFKPPVSGF